MNPTIIYFLKANIAIALFYLFYRLFFAGDTFWKTRRLYLTFSVLTSFIYPFLSITGWLEQSVPMQQLITNYTTLPEVTITPKENYSLGLLSILYMVYTFVAGILMVRLFVQVISILKMNRQGTKQWVQGTEVIALQRDLAPFSFFGKIYMNPSLHNEMQIREILAHELTHVRQLHSLDVILGEFLSILCWFNPASWLLKREIRQNLEFLADNKVIESGFDTKSYQYHLLQLSYQTPDLNLTNKFNISPLKKRITMMNQQKTSKVGIIKYLLIIPLGLALIVSSNAETLISASKKKLQANLPGVVMPPPPPESPTEVKIQVQEEISSPPVNAQPSEEEIEFFVVETMPQFPGGDTEMFKYLSQNVKYPAEAHKEGIQGRVICQFVVEKDGTISNVEVIRGVDPRLDAEAARVIQAMPAWTSGEQRGEKVRVKYTLPINFKLEGNTSKEKVVAEGPGIMVVDGEIKSAEYVSQLKKEDIEKVEVLKGATEEMRNELIKKYGEDASKGVILITTKK